MSENAWLLLIRPLFEEVLIAYLAFAALLFVARVVKDGLRPAVTIGRREVRTVPTVSLEAKPVAQTRPSHAPRRRLSPILIRRPKLARTSPVSRLS